MSDMKTIRCRTFKVAYNTFNGDPMRICRSMHKLTNSVKSKTNIWANEGKILKNTHDLMKSCRVRK
jgi:hypothetical protein